MGFVRQTMLIPIKTILCCVLLAILSSCAQRERPAPVEELHWKPISKNSSQHIVAPGETLYAVAFRYDLDYRHLAALNHLYRPYTLRVGQKLMLHGSQFSFNRPQTHKPHVVRQQKPHQYRQNWSRSPVRYGSSNWKWPVQGRIVANFLPSQGKKGIDIAGKKGDKIRAAADGVVAYSGGGLLGYGNLIIIKHNNEFLTAYGNNAKNLVKEGQRINVGQFIAEMGVIDRRYWGVHFEMRKAGNPVNPLEYLR
jgi:lipoprotein NlpD